MSPYSAVAAASVPEPTACFSIHASADPGVMPRVLELFAKRGLIPSRWHSAVGPSQDLVIDIQMEGMERDQALMFAAAIRQIVTVEVVLTSEKRMLQA